MKATALLRDLGQSLWLDNITRDLLNNGTLEHYINDLSITGLTSNPTIFDHAVKNSAAYDSAILDGSRRGKGGEAVFFDLALKDITRAADLFRPAYDRTNGVDGWVSLEVPPSFAYDTTKTLAAAKDLFARAARPNVFIKIPGTVEGIPAIEEAIFAGVPINVTLLFSSDQYVAAAEAYLRGIERRIAAGLKPVVESVASVFISRWDVAVANKVPEHLRGQLGIAVAGKVYRSYQALATLAALATCLQLWCPRPATSMGKHRDKGSGAAGYVLCKGIDGALYCEHHARSNAHCFRGSWRSRSCDVT